MASIYNISDADLLALLNAMLATISGDLPSYPGLTAGMLTAAGTIRDDFSDKLLVHNQAQDAARAGTIAKNEVRDLVIVEIIVKFRKLLDANGVAADKKAALGIPATESAGPASSTVPVATVDTSERLRQTVRFLDAAAGGNRRRPRGVDGCEIWVKVDGAPPGSEKDCVFLALDSATPYLVEYDPEDAGKTAHYMLRWLLRDGSKSAWGETVSATITG